MNTKAASIVVRQFRRRILRAGPAAAVCLLGLWMFSACSASPAASTAAGNGTAPNSRMEQSTPEAADAMGVYPPPTGGAQSTAEAKRIPHAEGTNSVYLPAVINQKPSQYPFELQQTGVLAVQGFSGCDWIAVAGQVFDLSGAPIQNLILHLEGIWAGKAVSSDALSGSAAQYGPAGYEFLLGTQPLDSTQALWIQMLDATRKQISPRVYLDTYNDCARNLILVNFVQVR
jgi:predicted heme/steroid binding protein